MRYSRSLGALLALISFVTGPVLIAIRRAATGWPALIDAKARLVLHALVRSRETATHLVARSRFAAFVRRSLAHDDYSAGRYDPGWRTA